MLHAQCILRALKNDMVTTEWKKKVAVTVACATLNLVCVFKN